MKKQKTKKTKNTFFAEEKESYPQLWGLGILLASLCLLLSMISFVYHPSKGNWLGLFGTALATSAHYAFGFASFLLPVFFGWTAIQMIRKQKNFTTPSTLIAFVILLICSSILITLATDVIAPLSDLETALYHTTPFTLGGRPWHYLYHDMPYLHLKTLLNIPGTFLIFGGLALLSIARIADIRLLDAIEKLKKEEDGACISVHQAEQTSSLFSKLSDKIQAVKDRIKPTSTPKEPDRPIRDEEPAEQLPLPSLERTTVEKTTIEKAALPEKNAAPSTSKEQLRQEAIEAQKVWNGDYSGYRLPKQKQLTDAKKFDQTALKKDLKEAAARLEETLESFGIEARVGKINCGPTITSFEVHPSVGVKVQKIKALENDIALNLQAASTRILAPIPGKAAVGIEIPNPKPQEVSFKELLLSYQKKGAQHKIPLLLGKAVNGDQVTTDLAKMPHCIIAGATGSGKSVCINTIVMSIIMTAKPDQIRLLMIDPKKVELSGYTRLPHMLSPVITEAAEATAALNWLVKEMERRYEMLKHVGVRNIESYNKRVKDQEKEEMIAAKQGAPLPDTLPYIVGIIDELADLMMVSSSDIETPIARIAQMARAVGIHLILATQRPSREVITGIIKANFPTRICFKVASRINSQIIIDDTGGETLLGNGDMLFLPPGTSTLIRAQGAYISDEDIRAVVKTACDQAPTNYVTESFEDLLLGKSGAKEPTAELDNLYEKAYDVVTSTGQASTTFLQRKLKIGYARAASIIDQLEGQKVIGPAEGSKGRKVLVTSGEEDEDFHGIE